MRNCVIAILHFQNFAIRSSPPVLRSTSLGSLPYGFNHLLSIQRHQFLSETVGMRVALSLFN
jgi:hypothetical protein